MKQRSHWLRGTFRLGLYEKTYKSNNNSIEKTGNRNAHTFRTLILGTKVTPTYKMTKDLDHSYLSLKSNHRAKSNPFT